ncbi:MAG: ATP-dependent RecD-like DNA helicase [Proteocatella sp.]
MESFEGKVLEIIFRNEDNGYTVGVLETSDNEIITFVGTFIAIEEFDYLKLTGKQKLHPTYGHQLEVRSYEIPNLGNTKSILAYLSSGIIDEIGPKIAARIVDRFGDGTLEVMDNEPSRLLEVEGIGKKKYNRIIQSYAEKVKLRSIIVGLAEFDISPNIAMKIYKAFGDSTIEVLKSNPYSICAKIKGIGFLKADEIAKKIGIPKDSLNRVSQGIKFVLEEFCYQGNSYIYLEELEEKSRRILGCDSEKFAEGFYELCVSGQSILENKDGIRRAYLYNFYKTENQVAKMIVDLLSRPASQMLSGKSSEIMIRETQDKVGKVLAEKQKEAVMSALENNVMVLTGGPGTGKTTIVSFIIECFEQIGKKVTLCAPTGRAAKRLCESSGKRASTIHRLLEVGYTDENSEEGYYNKDQDNPLDTDVLIVDEMSMVDIFLMKALLCAVKPGTVLIMVGDKDQLPSVGPGKVLWDFIDSNMVKTVTLDEIFRQAKESNIIINAHRVNKGEELELVKGAGDFFFMARNNQFEAKELIVELISQRLPGYFGVKTNDIQILTPIKKSEVGVIELNKKVQEAVNPSKPELQEFKHGDRIFRTNDKVMQIKNNYEKEFTGYAGIESGKGVFNGDIGYIDAVDGRAKQFYISFEDGRRCRYEFSEADNIDHAYAITVHKSQGSEFEIIIVPILALPPLMQNRNILYTALTRSKRAVVLVGSMYYINKMISNTSLVERNSSLSERIISIKQILADEDTEAKQDNKLKEIDEQA